MENQVSVHDASVQTDSVKTQQQGAKTQSKQMRRIRLCINVFKFLAIAILSIYTYHTTLSTFPNFRRFMFDELPEKIQVTEAEKSFMWTCIFWPVVSAFVTICKAVCVVLKANPKIWGKIVEYTSLWFVGTWIGKKLISLTVVEPCKRFAIKLLKFFCIVLCATCGSSLMFIGLCSVLKHYDIPDSITAAMARMSTVMPFL